MGKSSRKKKKSSGGTGPGEGGVESPRDPDNTRLPQKHLTHGTQNVNYFIAGSVSVITFIVYLFSLKNEFIVRWDDGLYIIDNPFISSFNINLFKQAFFDFYGSNWHPLTWISHALDYAVWGLNPLGHHLTNNILHAVNTFLVVLLVVRLLEAVHDSPFTIHHSQFTLIAAATTGLLFGLHPIHVESVAWVAERKDLLCGLFFLLTIMAYMRYADASSSHSAKGIEHSKKDNVQSAESKEKKAVSSMRYALCFFVLALLSKPMAVSLPVVLLILDWYPFRRIQSLKSFRPVFIEKLPFIALSLISSILTVLAQKTGGAMDLMQILPLSSRLLVAAKSLVAYLWMMIWPVALIPYYPYPKDLSFFSLGYLSAVVLIVVITAACVAMAKRRKVLLSVWGYYVVTLIPVLGIVQVGGQAMADRYTYLPSLGPFLIMGLAAAWVSARVPSVKKWGLSSTLVIVAAAAVLVSPMTYLTVKQISIWKSSFTLWDYVIERQAVGVPQAYTNRGLTFIDMGQPDKAMEDFDKAIALEPAFYEAYNNRGGAFEKMGQLDRAIEDFNRAIALKPRYGEAYYNRGVAYGEAGSFDKSIESFNKSLEINPNKVDAYVSRGISYALLGQHDRAMDDFSKAIELNRNFSAAYLNRGNLYKTTGKKELATSDFQKACELGEQKGCEALQAVR